MWRFNSFVQIDGEHLVKHCENRWLEKIRCSWCVFQYFRAEEWLLGEKSHDHWLWKVERSVIIKYILLLPLARIFSDH